MILAPVPLRDTFPHATNLCAPVGVPSRLGNTESAMDDGMTWTNWIMLYMFQNDLTSSLS